MSEEWREQSFLSSLAMTAAVGQPLNLVECAQPLAKMRGEAIEVLHLTAAIEAAPPQSAFLSKLGLQVHRWDAEDEDVPWTRGSKRSTPDRRAVICSLLGLDGAGAAALLAKRPIFSDPTVVITAPWKRWYTPQRAYAHEFYWPRYRDYLLNVKKWPSENVTVLDKATTDVVERLADPTQQGAHQAKGLVVGYVQSGKTANFTGVIAKAIDAGYRLIIVMTGTIEMLRGQTQRRIDKEMVGQQNITADFTPQQAQENVDYQDDKEWLAGHFLDLGVDEPPTGILRLTHHKKDYQKQFKTLRIDRIDPARPLYDPANVFPAAARLVIVKKNAAVLKKLVSDIQANNKAFAEIPVLIVDDESDHASVNTVDPRAIAAAKKEGKVIKMRRAINERIATMLLLMPRAQYVAYTATPFANVFVDPSDAQGIFPKDFVISLQRPPGYLGIEDFHDLGEPPSEPASAQNSNKKAFVRPLTASEADTASQDRELETAVDMFVLTGAVKLYRQSKDPQLSFQHHTMLIHDSVRTDDHKEAAARVRRIWTAAQFTGLRGKARLRTLYEQDVAPVSSAREEPRSGLRSTPSFDEVAPFIGTAIGRIEASDLNPVLVVNSDKDIQAQQQTLDFDRKDTWRILVGGAKLSRGFTVEGLTVTYFRRATNMSDSLTQMGRWFGFRDGYRDLVRLYIAKHAQFGGEEVDIYAAFENAALDEAAFRKQLMAYAEWDGDKPRLLPSQIPPLVFQHMPWLKPTARNKMFNAVITEQSEQPFTPTGYSNHADGLKASLDRWRPILASGSMPVTLPQGRAEGSYQALVGVMDADAVIAAMEETRYLVSYRERSIAPKLAFYRRLTAEGLLRDFLVVVPQPKTDLSCQINGVGERAITSRDRRAGRGGLFGEMTDPKHKPPLELFVGENAPLPAALQTWASPTRGALLFYLAKESVPAFEELPLPTVSAADPEFGLVVAYSSYVPSSLLSNKRAVIKFTVLVEDKKADPVVDAAETDV